MSTPSNPSGIPSLPVIGLLAVILFLGLALAPRAFEFRAWPEFARQNAIERVVDRPLPTAPRIEVAGVDAGEARRGSGSRDAVAGGRSRRLDVRGERRRDARARAARRGSGARGSQRRGRQDRGGSSQVPGTDAPQVVEVPTPSNEQPNPAPEQPTQVAEVPSADTNLRPQAPQQVPDAPRDFSVSNSGGGELDVRGKGNGRGHGRGNGQSNGSGRGKGHGQGNAQGQAQGQGSGSGAGQGNGRKRGRGCRD